MLRAWILAAGLGLALYGSAARAAEEINFTLNYIAGGDHAPLYYARQQGWFSDAGLNVTILQGQGSAATLRHIAAGSSQVGIVDMATVLIGMSKGVDAVGVMNIYANSPYGIYWLKSSGVASVADLAGRKIGTPPGDAARNLWVPLARKAQIDPRSVSWVNISAATKLAALKSGTIDATTTFYTSHYLYLRELGDNLGYAAWHEYGINSYSNSVVFNKSYAASHSDQVRAFVGVVQKAYIACVQTPDPCIDALVVANSGLKRDDMMNAWLATVELMTTKDASSIAFGTFLPERMASDYHLVKEYFGLDREFDVKGSYSNDFLDPKLRLAK